MKRILFVAILCVLALTTSVSTSDAQRSIKDTANATPAPTGKITVPCPDPLDDITHCPDTGCGTLDPFLNKQKNIRSDDQAAEAMTVQQIRNLPDPVSGFRIDDSREKLEALGEGKKIVVVANALVA